MTTPTNAFAWLLAEFHRYSHGQTSWQDVRQVLGDADDLLDQFRDAEQINDTSSFARMLQDQRQAHAGLLTGCTEDYLWDRLQRYVDQQNPAVVSYMSLLLWQRLHDGVMPITD